MNTKILIVGSGSLARAISYASALLFSRPHGVTVCARSRKQLNEIVYVSRAKAASVQSPVTFDSVEFEPESDDAIRLLSSLQPDVIVNCVSYHSPWEGMTRPSLWTQLVSSAGFGFALPLQAAFAIKFAKAVLAHPRSVLFINGCYPDAVNPVLRTLGLPVFCGIGNVAVLATTLRYSLGLTPGQRLQIIGHHVHLKTPKPGVEEVQAWVDGKHYGDVGGFLTAQRDTSGMEVNKVTGCTAALLLRDIIEEREVETHVPGPFGLPGGYPVCITGKYIRLSLPADLPEREAIAWNEKAAIADGVKILSQGNVELGREAKRAFSQYLPQAADGFHVSEIETITQAMLELRAKLTQMSIQPVPDAENSIIG